MLIVYPVGSQVNKKTPTKEGYESAATISIVGSLERRHRRPTLFGMRRQ